MNVTYEAWQLPRGNVVVRIVDGAREKAEVVSDSHLRINDAQDEADQRNMDSWLSEKPGDAPADNWDIDRCGAELLDILDRMYGPEDRAELCLVGLRRAAA